VRAASGLQAPPRDVVAVLGFVAIEERVGLGHEEPDRAGVAHVYIRGCAVIEQVDVLDGDELGVDPRRRSRRSANSDTEVVLDNVGSRLQNTLR
jgi:hypothetical protein